MSQVQSRWALGGLIWYCSHRRMSAVAGLSEPSGNQARRIVPSQKSRQQLRIGRWFRIKPQVLLAQIDRLPDCVAAKRMELFSLSILRLISNKTHMWSNTGTCSFERRYCSKRSNAFSSKLVDTAQVVVESTTSCKDIAQRQRSRDA